MYRFLSIGYSLISAVACLWMIVQSPCSLETVGDLVLIPDAQKQDVEQCATFRSSCWESAFVDIKEVLPDLRRDLVFLGSNRRPDATTKTVFLELRSSKSRCTARIGEKIYLCQQVTPSGAHFIFTSNPCSRCWIECRFVGQDDLEVHVFLKSIEGQIITEPKEWSQFRLTPQYASVHPWEIGGIRVDSSFAIKQKIRRVGIDKFLCLHGGEEFLDKAQKERVDFESASGEPYSCYLSSSDILFWDGNRWQQYGEFVGDGQQAPLLEVKKIDEKIMTVDIWNVAGTAHQTVHLVKSSASSLDIASALKELKFIGMRTWTRPIIQAGNQRFILNSDDWLLRKEQHWEQIHTKEQLEDYISGKIQCPLFVFEGLEKDKDGFILKGHLFNAQRTHVESIALVLHQDQPEKSEKEVTHGTKSSVHAEKYNTREEGK